MYILKDGDVGLARTLKKERLILKSKSEKNWLKLNKLKEKDVTEK
jgi:hypothetical protein